MLQSAMSRIEPGTAGHRLLADRGDDESRLRRTVIAGPGGSVEVGDTLLGGALVAVADEAVITAGLAAAGHTDRRCRVLTGLVTVTAVLGLCLFRRESYDLVLSRVLPVTPAQVLDGGPPTGQALSTARARLDPNSMRAVFEHAAAVMPAAGAGSYAFGLLLTAFDGTVIDLAATGDIAAAYATPSGGKYPQARLVTLVTCGTRWIIGPPPRTAVHAANKHLVDRLADALQPGTLNLADRNFFSMARWIRFTATGAQLAWRVKNGAKSLPARIIRMLPDGSALVRLRESDSMLSYRRTKAGDKSLARLPDTIARLVEFTLTVTDEAGKTRTTLFRILTTLLDHEQYPAEQIAADIRPTMAGRDHLPQVESHPPRTRNPATRTDTPACRTRNLRTAHRLQHPRTPRRRRGSRPRHRPRRNQLRRRRRTHPRRHRAPDAPDADTPPTNPAEDLITAITAQPRNRTDRQRTSPTHHHTTTHRTNTQRQLHHHHRHARST